MKIGVISDTHLKSPDPDFKKIVNFYFNDVDKIFHLGDFIDISIAEYLSTIKELIAVAGNMDHLNIHRSFPKKRVIELGEFKIGLIHGDGPPFDIESRIMEHFDDVQAIVYGHTHTPSNHKMKGIYFFNPGSLTRSFVDKGTIGILHINDKIEGEIIKI